MARKKTTRTRRSNGSRKPPAAPKPHEMGVEQRVTTAKEEILSVCEKYGIYLESSVIKVRGLEPYGGPIHYLPHPHFGPPPPESEEPALPETKDEPQREPAARNTSEAESEKTET